MMGVIKQQNFSISFYCFFIRRTSIFKLSRFIYKLLLVFVRRERSDQRTSISLDNIHTLNLKAFQMITFDLKLLSLLPMFSNYLFNINIWSDVDYY